MKDLKIAIRFFAAFTILCGGVYPGLVTVLANALFPRQAAGSLVIGKDGNPAGSLLIGQPFSGPGYFWPRPSATAGFAYNPMASGGSNLGPSNPALLTGVAARRDMLRSAGIADPVPADLALASASGLDPHITPESARVQADRVSRARGMDAEVLLRLVAEHIEDRALGFLGQPRVNVLALNRDLDQLP